MSTEAVVLLIVWVSSGLAGAWVLNRRSGRPSGFWYGVCLVLGPFGLPIAWELSEQRPTDVIERQPGHDRGGLRVVAALDESPASEQAVVDAVHLLGMRIGSLALVHVLDYDPDALEEDRVPEATAMLEGAASRLPPAAPRPALVVAAGPPVDAVLELATRERADLVVLGHGRAGPSRTSLGSVSEGVTKRSSLPVLLGGALSDVVR